MNGLIFNHTNSDITIKIIIHAGSNNDELKGTAHFIEHLFFHLDSIILLNNINATYNAKTTKTKTIFFVTGNSLYGKLLLEIMLNCYFNITFDIDKTRNVLLSELNMYFDSPNYHLTQLFNEHYYKDTANSFSSFGTKKDIKLITIDDLITFKHTYYIPENTQFIISGIFQEELFRKRLRIFDRKININNITYPINKNTTFIGRINNNLNEAYCYFCTYDIIPNELEYILKNIYGLIYYFRKQNDFINIIYFTSKPEYLKFNIDIIKKIINCDNYSVFYFSNEKINDS